MRGEAPKSSLTWECRASGFSTTRLRCRWLDERDAPFLLELLNDPAFLDAIGDRQVRTHQQALDFLEYSVRDSYRTYGFGPFVIEWREGQQGRQATAGLCGLYRRDYLTCPDVGYALLPHARGLGVAREAAAGTLRWGTAALGIDEVVGITAPGNGRSSRVLESCGLRLAGVVKTRLGGVLSELYTPRSSCRPTAEFVDTKHAALLRDLAP
ncbi:MAG: GNAT family N-acetyltransferase [Pseudomonadota bacterium]